MKSILAALLVAPLVALYAADAPDWWKTHSPSGGKAKSDEPPAKKKRKAR